MGKFSSCPSHPFLPCPAMLAAYQLFTSGGILLSKSRGGGLGRMDNGLDFGKTSSACFRIC